MSGSTIGALLYLSLTSLQNQLRSRLKRLRQPKYLLGAVVGVAYLYFIFFRRMHVPRANVATIDANVLPMAAALGALALFVVLALSWIVPSGPAALAFSEAEIAFLFPAPLRRRTLIHYRVLSSQAGLAFTALILAVVSNRWTFLGGNVWTHAIGWWLILAVVNLHMMGASFAITRLMNRGIRTWQRRCALLLLLAAAIAGSVAWARSRGALPVIADFAGLGPLARYVSTLLNDGPLYWLLALPRVAIAPFVAVDTRAFLAAMGPAVLVLVAHYAWVMYSDVSFEDASLTKAEKRAAKLAAFRKGDMRAGSASRKGRRDPFRLASTGRPELAFLWKNLLSTSAFFRPRNLAIAATVVILSCVWLRNVGAASIIIGSLSVITLGMILLLGPQIARQDLRADILNTDLLKTYPLRGWQIVAGQILTPVTALTACVWLVLLAATLSLPGHRPGWLTPDVRIQLGISFALIAVPFCAIQLLIPNAMAILFPAWVRLAADRGERGLDVMGQRIIFLAAQTLVALFAIVPAAIVATLLFIGTSWLIGTTAAAVIALIGILVVLALEAWLGILWLGSRFDAFDLSSELRP